MSLLPKTMQHLHILYCFEFADPSVKFSRKIYTFECGPAIKKYGIYLSDMIIYISFLLSAHQVNDVNFENMSNDDAVRILREIVSKTG